MTFIDNFDPQSQSVVISTKASSKGWPDFLCFRALSKRKHEKVNKAMCTAQKTTRRICETWRELLTLNSIFQTQKYLVICPLPPLKPSYYLWRRHLKELQHMLALLMKTKQTVVKELLPHMIDTAIEQMPAGSKVLILRSSYEPASKESEIHFAEEVAEMATSKMDGTLVSTDIRCLDKIEWLAFMPAKYLDPEDKEVFEALKQSFNVDPITLRISYA